MFHLTSKWRNILLVKHFENGTNLLIPTTTRCKMYRVFSHLHNWITEWFQSHMGNIFLFFCMKYEVFTVVKVQIVVFLGILLSRWVQHCRNSEDGGTRLLQNISNHLWTAWCHNSNDHSLTSFACFVHFCVQSDNVV
jgi:hypothetical protein